MTVSGVNPKEFEIFQQTQLTLLKSQFVLKAALARRDIAQLNAVLAHRRRRIDLAERRVEGLVPRRK